MPITPETLAERLKRERNRLGLTQEEVAERLGVKRPTIVQMEAAKRAVTSIELSQLAALYRRSTEFFLSESDMGEAGGVMHLRSNCDLDEPVRYNLDKCIAVCEAATELERLLDKRRGGMAFSYTIDRPQTRWEAVNQGVRLAAMERERLHLGSLPARNIVEIIAQHGVRVGRYTLTDDISGLFFSSPTTGMAILVNAGHSATRRLFSYAHEYAHLLVDSVQTPGGVSRFGNRDDLLEVRANTFAAHFLMPEDGIRNFLEGLGGPSRQVTEIYDGFKDQPDYREEELVTAQRRATPGSQEIRTLDAWQLAWHFGTSYSATVYQLLNLKMIQRETLDRLLNDQQAEQMGALLGDPPRYLERETAADLKQTLVNLIVEAWIQKEITKPRAQEYIKLVDIAPEKLDNLSVVA